MVVVIVAQGTACVKDRLAEWETAVRVAIASAEAQEVETRCAEDLERAATGGLTAASKAPGG